MSEERYGTPLRDVAPLALRLARFVRLPTDEAAMLPKLLSATRTVERGRKLTVQGKRYGKVFVILDGIAIRYRVLRDGRRQIISVVVPGDVVGYNGPLAADTLFSTLALTPLVVAPIEHSRLLRLLATNPRLATKIFLLFSANGSIEAERLVDLGRRSASERIAHFLLELLTRLQTVGLADDTSFQVPLTQDLISDALGLSVTQVHRVFQRFRSSGLLRVDDQRIVVMDVARLTALADFNADYLQPRLPNEIFDRVA